MLKMHVCNKYLFDCGVQEAQLWLTGGRSADRLLCDEAIHTCQEAVHSLYVVGAPNLHPNAT